MIRPYLLLLALLVTLFQSVPAGAATLLGEWRLEEDAWNGVSGEVKDSSGNNRHGTAIGSLLPGLDNAAPAHTGDPGTCDYGLFGGASSGGPALSLPGLPVDTRAGAKTSVAFWMYWDGTDNVMPLGWNVHDLWLVSGAFGFNTGNSDVFGISSASLANGWHHVVAVFTNGAVASNELYIDGAKQTLTQRRSSPNNSYAYVRSTLQVSGWGTNSGYRFSGRIDDVKVYDGAVSQAEVNAAYAATHACPLHPPLPPATLAAEYRFDDAWSTSVPLHDSSGNGLDAALNGGSVDQVNAPASGLKPETCKAGSFDRHGYFLVSGLPLNTRAGAKATVAFWMYWDGRYPSDGWAMPFRWASHPYDLAFKSNGWFGFNTGQGDIYGFSSSSLANGWHHVVAVFTSGGVGSNKIYLDGQLRVLQSNGSHAARLLSTSAFIGANGNGSSSYKYGGLLDSLSIHQGELTQAEVGTLYRKEQPCGGTTCAYPLHAGGSLSVGKESKINGNTISGSGNAIDPANGNLVNAPQALSAHNPASFPSYSGGNNYSGSASNLVPGTTYNSVTLTSGTAPSGTYNISTLNMDGNVTFTGGTFYVKTMTVDNDRNLFFTAATQFRVGTRFSADKEVDMLDSSGAHNPWAQFFLYDPADWTADKELRFDGIVVANGAGSDITVDKELEMTGAFITAGAINIDKEARISYTSAVATALGGSGVCGGGVTPPTPTAPANFNCVEVGANASSGHLYSKLVGGNFNFDIVALKADGTVETRYAADANKIVTVQLVDGAGATACASRATLFTWPSQTFTSGNVGRMTASAASLSSAYPNLRCRVSDGSVTGCSSDNFSVRPGGLTVTSSANTDAAGTNTAAAPTVKAGTSFTLTATASAGYNGTPTLDVSKVQAHSGATRSGGLAGGFGAANAASGIATGNFTYDEVGYFRFAANGVIDTTFSTVDAANGDCTADYSNTLVGGKFGCYFGNTAASNYFGRFIPDHFSIAPGALTQGCGSFTYFGQDFATDFTLFAQNSANTTTQNYAGGYARLGLANWSTFAFAASGATLVTGATAPSGSWNSGVASMSASHKANRPLSGAPPSPADLTVTMQPVDSDGVTMTAGAVSNTAAPHRFGRLRLANSVGSELLPLPLPLTAQYWNGQGYVSNSADNCTTISTPTLTFFSQTADNQLASGETTASFNATLIAGNGNLRFSAPGAGNFGFMDLSIAAPAWLKFNWDGVDQDGDGNGLDDDPRARATFGKRRGSDKVIIRREIY